MPVPVYKGVLFSGTSRNHDHQNKAQTNEGKSIQNQYVLDVVNN